MKKALLIAAAVMLIANAVFAELPPVGYIGIFKDMTHNTDPAANYVCPSPYGQTTAVIWCLPGQDGLMAVEFDLGYPATMIETARMRNPLLTVELGIPTEGISVSFGEGGCQRDWVWLYQLTCMVLTSAPQKVEIVPHPGTLPVPEYHFATCAPGYPIEQCRYLTPLYVCWTPSPLGVEESNWGAIKSLF